MKTIICGLLIFSLLSAEQISTRLTDRAQKGADRATLWNMGFQMFYRFGFPRKDMAARLAEGYAAAKGINQEQEEVFKQAARFWNDQAMYWDLMMQPSSLPLQRDESKKFVPGFYSPKEKLLLYPVPKPE